MDNLLIQKVKMSYEQVFEELSTIINQPTFFNLSNIKDYDFTQNFAIAMQLYMEQDPTPNLYTSYPDLINDPPTEVKWRKEVWQNISLTTEIKIKKISETYTQDKLWELIKEVSLKNDWWALGDLAGFVYSDFINLLEFFAYRRWSDDKIESLFLEKQYQVYKSGGFPYGWKGKYPEGNLLVYLPISLTKYQLLNNFSQILKQIIH